MTWLFFNHWEPIWHMQYQPKKKRNFIIAPGNVTVWQTLPLSCVATLPKKKYRSGPVFFVVALGNISFDMTVTPHLWGVSCDQTRVGHDNELYIHCTHNFCMYYRSNYGQMKSYESLRCDVCRCCECSAAVSSAVGIWLRRAWELDVRVWTLFVNIERWSHIVMLSQSCAKIKSLSDMTKKGVQQSGNIFSKSTNIYKSCNRDLMWQYLEPYLHRTGSDRSS